MIYFYGFLQSQTRKRLDLALGLAGLDSLPDAANNVRRSTSAYKQSAKRREVHTRISQHKTHNRTCTHAQTRRLSRNWTDRTRLATLAPHLTSAKSDTSKGPRSVITSIWVGHFDRVLVAKNTFENADKFVIVNNLSWTKTSI